MNNVKTTNQIEVALAKKVEQEITEIVDSFMNDIQTKLAAKYGGSSFFDLEQRGKNGDRITCLREGQLKDLLYDCLESNYSKNMLAKKSKELISKLDLL